MKKMKPLLNQPVSTRVYERILEFISEEDIVGDKLPPEMVLAKQLGVSRTALREALLRLESEGYISRRRKVGTIVLAKRLNLDAGLERLNSITQIIESAGMEPGTAFRHWRCEPANNLIAQMLKINVGDEITVIERVRTANDIRICYDINFIPNKYINEKDKNKFTESLLQYLSLKHGPIVRALAYLYSHTADEMISEKLNIPIGNHVMLIEHTYYTQNGRPIWYSRTFHRSDVISFHINRFL
ncbi:GntR family transcriptional regulator [Atribacter laminatus]|uniref:HTH-type transcriptional repressor YvoA n=1 Tax=Atribacter laminatus TaxID=2847778 RepID=A0A7T1F2C7_ATRLM|nr:GntR family transcriptional regulator [Atribacter laminatus]QPM67652.1 HTH-type transcriptional repressor YvoA [Atribacter laminatus]